MNSIKSNWETWLKEHFTDLTVTVMKKSLMQKFIFCAVGET